GLIAVVAVPPLVAAAFTEPDGFGAVKFGTPPDAAKKVYPAMTALGVPGGAQPTWLKSFVVENQAVGTLKSCRIELRFLKDQFFEGSCVCPDNDAVVAYLKKNYGEATKVEANSFLWHGSKT